MWSDDAWVKEFRRATRWWNPVFSLEDGGDVARMYHKFDCFRAYFRLYAGSPPTLYGSWAVPSALLDKKGWDEVAKQALSALAKVLAGRNVAGAKGLAVAPADAQAYPLLVEMCTQLQYPDGSTREPSRLTITSDREGGGWRVMLKDETAGLVLWSHADTLKDVLGCVESHLSADEPDWRPDRYAAKDKPRKGTR